MFNIEYQEKYSLAVGYQNQKNQTEDKCNQLNLMDIKSMLGTNHCLTLSHIAKSYMWLEETNDVCARNPDE